MSDHLRERRVAGALIGSVVGDALGAPFEFGPAGAFSKRFPAPARGVATEMCGGGPWEPGEWTDDTQMALLVAESLARMWRLGREGDVRAVPTVGRRRPQGRRHPDLRRAPVWPAVGPGSSPLLQVGSTGSR